MKSIDSSFENDIENGSNHEIMSCLLILLNFKLLLEQYVEDLDLSLIFRIITGIRYKTADKWVENILIEIVNSSTVDVDKLDYLLRDNFMTGNIAPIIDYERLILSIAISPNHQLCFKRVGISSLVSLKESKDFLYLWVYNHHTVVYTDFLYKTAIEHLINEKNTYSHKENRILIKDLFSVKAISERLIADHNIDHYLYNEYLNPSKYSDKILKQLVGVTSFL